MIQKLRQHDDGDDARDDHGIHTRNVHRVHDGDAHARGDARGSHNVRRDYGGVHDVHDIRSRNLHRDDARDDVRDGDHGNRNHNVHHGRDRDGSHDDGGDARDLRWQNLQRTSRRPPHSTNKIRHYQRKKQQSNPYFKRTFHIS